MRTVRPWYFISGVLLVFLAFLLMRRAGFDPFLAGIGVALGIADGWHTSRKITKDVTTRGEYKPSRAGSIVPWLVFVAIFLTFFIASDARPLWQPAYWGLLDVIAKYSASFSVVIGTAYLTTGIIVLRWENNQNKRLMLEGRWNPKLIARDNAK